MQWILTNQDGFFQTLEGDVALAQDFAIETALQLGTDMLLFDAGDLRDDVYLVSVIQRAQCTLATIEHICV